jgi:hypothetical protein
MPGPARPTWVFDPLPASGARRGGDPSEHVFKHDLDTFVREVVQNANDQRVAAPSVDFTLAELSGEGRKSFLDALDYKALEEHLISRPATRDGRRIAARAGQVRQGKTLRVLRVEDRGTVGLTGEEDSGESHFRALCKDVLYTHKRSEGAGGSYGLGKSVLWTFSGLNTVIFNSVPKDVSKGTKPPRLIGRAELPSHSVGRDWFSGPGWFGVPTRIGSSLRAESVWSLNAGQCARELGIDRKKLDTGTSILILDFREPASEGEATLQELDQQIRNAAARWFWPAMTFEGRALAVSTQEGTPVNPTDHADIAPFVHCYRARRSTRTSLDEPGDVVCRDLDLELPAQRDGARAHGAKVRLIVRLAEEKASGPLVSHVALFRGAGMVVKYWDRSALSAQGSPFHAVLACGEARDPESVTDADRLVEAFLRDAEPPGHDEWESTPGLKDAWERGYAKALQQLTDRVTQALRDLLNPAVTYGTRGPELLQKRFPFGPKGTPGSAPSAFHFSDLRAQLSGDTWQFTGELSPTKGKGRWEALIRLRELGEDGSAVRDIPIARLATTGTEAQVTVGEGQAHVSVSGGTDVLGFSGESEALLEPPEEMGLLSLEVTGSRP